MMNQWMHWIFLDDTNLTCMDLRGPAEFGFCSSNIFQYLTNSFNSSPVSLGVECSKLERSIQLINFWSWMKWPHCTWTIRVACSSPCPGYDKGKSFFDSISCEVRDGREHKIMPRPRMDDFVILGLYDFWCFIFNMSIDFGWILMCLSWVFHE